MASIIMREGEKSTVRLVFSSFSVSLEEVLSLQAYSSGTGNSSGHIPEQKKYEKEINKDVLLVAI